MKKALLPIYNMVTGTYVNIQTADQVVFVGTETGGNMNGGYYVSSLF